ncbi:CLUMA_CG010239, isoform A [Clunio marinus]|uniref:CLUMA_CG010239, isoform A n=1 Tax=Clunio marinus TaxID=568069 RepID=A0A1J1IDK8_9DIPT|nr:CLUMA_CG010239, isoform A [Clunio marinus]
MSVGLNGLAWLIDRCKTYKKNIQEKPQNVERASFVKDFIIISKYTLKRFSTKLFVFEWNINSKRNPQSASTHKSKGES